MKVTCTFDKETRVLQLTPEDDLELTLLDQIIDRTEKGSQLKVAKIASGHPGLVVELKVNGH